VAGARGFAGLLSVRLSLILTIVFQLSCSLGANSIHPPLGKALSPAVTSSSTIWEEVHMDVDGEERIAAPRAVVWSALNDPEILRQCIPGCQSLEKTSPTELVTTVRIKIGPVGATFSGEITLSNINAPESYTISGEGKGGIAGFGKGAADVVLIEDGDETILRYVAKAQVGGKLAQLGSRLIDSASRKLAQQFFADFNAAVAADGQT
jgi:carbon monoxide dehydrogenase subunit G